MGETPEELQRRLGEKRERHRLQAAKYACPVEGCGRQIDEPQVHRLRRVPASPELGDVDTYFCPKCETHLVRDNPGDPWAR
jgi:hypothetical protein